MQLLFTRKSGLGVEGGRATELVDASWILAMTDELLRDVYSDLQHVAVTPRSGSARYQAREVSLLLVQALGAAPPVNYRVMFNSHRPQAAMVSGPDTASTSRASLDDTAPAPSIPRQYRESP